MAADSADLYHGEREGGGGRSRLAAVVVQGTDPAQEDQPGGGARRQRDVGYRESQGLELDAANAGSTGDRGERQLYTRSADSKSGGRRPEGRIGEDADEVAGRPRSQFSGADRAAGVRGVYRPGGVINSGVSAVGGAKARGLASSSTANSASTVAPLVFLTPPWRDGCRLFRSSRSCRRGRSSCRRNSAAGIRGGRCGIRHSPACFPGGACE